MFFLCVFFWWGGVFPSCHPGKTRLFFAGDAQRKERERQTDRQTDRNRETETDKQTDSDRQRRRKTHRERCEVSKRKYQKNAANTVLRVARFM